MITVGPSIFLTIFIFGFTPLLTGRWPLGWLSHKMYKPLGGYDIKRHFRFNGFPLMFTSNAGCFPIHLTDFALKKLSLSFPPLLCTRLWSPLPHSSSRPLIKKMGVFSIWSLTCLPLSVIYFSRPKKLTLKGYKQYWCTFKDITISCYKSKEEAHGTPALQMNLRGANTQNVISCPCKNTLLIFSV